MEKYHWIVTSSIFIADLAIRIGLSLRVIMRKRAASVTLAWLVIILLLPFVGAIIYLLLGENRIGQKRAAHAARNLPLFKEWAAKLEERAQVDWDTVNPECRPIDKQANSIMGLPTVGGNEVTLLEDAENFFNSLIADIDRAKESCSLEFYIWHPGGRTEEVAASLVRAASRGVKCKVLLDSIGSADFLKSSLAREMRSKGIEITEALPAGLFRALFVRIDLRNHRKIVLIDNEIGYTGSQNLVDPRYFKQEEEVGQWIDTMVRLRGPVVEKMAATFLFDWFVENNISLDEMKEIGKIKPIPQAGDVPIQLVPSGPGFEEDGIHDLLLTTIYAARKELVLTSPYFVPDNAILSALKSAARRGVDVTIIVPRKNDSRLVHYASRARYGQLARSGVKIMPFQKGLLHAKTITVDRDFSLIGSVNLDMRSFWLNFELTLFVYNRRFTEQLRAVQQTYIEGSQLLDSKHFDQRSFLLRLKENCALIIGPLL
ncbi:MAG: cardiolipin synthase [Desulfobulbaceae bacterium]|nr:cardiolipin synthase [Desulfobulbaceae bacterium]